MPSPVCYSTNILHHRQLHKEPVNCNGFFGFVYPFFYFPIFSVISGHSQEINVFKYFLA